MLCSELYSILLYPQHNILMMVKLVNLPIVKLYILIYLSIYYSDKYLIPASSLTGHIGLYTRILMPYSTEVGHSSNPPSDIERFANK